MQGIAELEGVGATAERKLEQIAPLVEYYEREMGVGAGRLMLATNFLRDARQMQSHTPEVAAALEQAEALVVSVMIRFLNGQQGENVLHRPNASGDNESCACCDTESQMQTMQAWMDRQGGDQA